MPIVFTMSVLVGDSCLDVVSPLKLNPGKHQVKIAAKE
jgi:hypothetical protein